MECPQSKQVEDRKRQGQRDTKLNGSQCAGMQASAIISQHHIGEEKTDLPPFLPKLLNNQKNKLIIKQGVGEDSPLY